MKNLKKAITLVLALIIALITCMVGVSASATEDEVTTTPTEKATGDYFISDAEGADRESAKTYAYGYVGDVDLTDSVNIKDATTIQKHVANLLTLKDTNSILADADMSGDVNVKDATTIQKWIAGIKVNAPVYHLLSDKLLSNDEHIHAYNISSQSANCKQEGYIQYTCKCGEEYKTNETDKGEHNWGEWQVITPPTKDTYGESRSYCKNCDDFKPMMVDKIRDDASTTEPYFVSCEFVSETRPNTFYVDGTDVLSRIYGKEHYAYQAGDTITYKINMSDGGSTGFRITQEFNCSATISGNFITLKFKESWNPNASAELLVNTKDGTKYVNVDKFVLYNRSGDLAGDGGELLETYAKNKGMTYVNGVDLAGIKHEVRKVKIPNNSNWFKQSLEVVDELANMGCIKFTYQCVYQDCFVIGAI